VLWLLIIIGYSESHEKNIILAITATALVAVAGCGQDLPDESSYYDTSNQVRYAETSTTEIMAPETSVDEYYLEATWQVASTIKIEASLYFTEEIPHSQIIHDIVYEDGGFGSHLIKTHPALKDMEYILEFDDRDAPCNVFCIQKHTDPVTIGCSGTYKKLSDWGFKSWDDVLKHFDLSSL